MECDINYEQSVSEKPAETANNAMETAITATPIPTVTHFLERKNIAKWVKTWNKPSLPCYVYLYRKRVKNMWGEYATLKMWHSSYHLL